MPLTDVLQSPSPVFNPGRPFSGGSESHLISFLVSVGNPYPAFATVFVQESREKKEKLTLHKIWLSDNLLIHRWFQPEGETSSLREFLLLRGLCGSRNGFPRILSGFLLGPWSPRWGPRVTSLPSNPHLVGAALYHSLLNWNSCPDSLFSWFLGILGCVLRQLTCLFIFLESEATFSA